MRNTLAERLLATIMKWTPSQIDEERPLLQALADFKLNDYQQFSPGTRFIESLVKWLQQFETLEEKNTAYLLMKNHLIFISGEQLAHLVNILFSEKINPILIKKTAKETGSQPFLVTRLVNSAAYELNLGMSLFIGLSDGSKIDQFRRSANLNNEQVYPTYLINSTKAADMLKKLQGKIDGGKFKTIFLIDDFTASGTSYCRPDDDNGRGDGKILVFLNQLFNTAEGGNAEINSIVDFQHLEIHILFYIATGDAISNIDKAIVKWQKNNNEAFNYKVDALLLLDDKIKKRVTDDESIVALLKKYFDNEVVDEHYEKGRHEEPYLGFNECGLPLVLNHNTPNNSLPLFWLPEDKKFVGLFPRISRHK